MFISIKAADIVSENSGDFIIALDNIAGINEYDGNLRITFKTPVLERSSIDYISYIDVNKTSASFFANFRNLKLNT